MNQEMNQRSGDGREEGAKRGEVGRWPRLCERGCSVMDVMLLLFIWCLSITSKYLCISGFHIILPRVITTLYYITLYSTLLYSTILCSSIQPHYHHLQNKYNITGLPRIISTDINISSQPIRVLHPAFGSTLFRADHSYMYEEEYVCAGGRLELPH